jgi:hypothetical protein
MTARDIDKDFQVAYHDDKSQNPNPNPKPETKLAPFQMTETKNKGQKAAPQDSHEVHDINTKCITEV